MVTLLFSEIFQIDEIKLLMYNSIREHKKYKRTLGLITCTTKLANHITLFWSHVYINHTCR